MLGRLYHGPLVTRWMLSLYSRMTTRDTAAKRALYKQSGVTQ